ncbi:hypothetical protein ACG9X6_20215 [Acinetobacter guillouiae]|uniref:hypothetical protein n=1 Tax=Acinetobacter guillouiae TaxID=106649 RepID=UPI003AF882DC
MSNNLSFSTKQEFIQCAFETVAKIVSDQGQIALDAMTPAISTQRCLSHLAFVCHEWSYDPTVIDTYANLYKESNSELIEAFGEE